MKQKRELILKIVYDPDIANYEDVGALSRSLQRFSREATGGLPADYGTWDELESGEGWRLEYEVNYFDEDESRERWNVNQGTAGSALLNGTGIVEDEGFLNLDEIGGTDGIG